MTKTVVTSYDQVQEWSIVSDAVRHENFRMKFSLFNLEGTRKWTGDGGLAQLGERLPCKQEVSGSIPLISTNTNLTKNTAIRPSEAVGSREEKRLSGRMPARSDGEAKRGQL